MINLITAYTATTVATATVVSKSTVLDSTDHASDKSEGEGTLEEREAEEYGDIDAYLEAKKSTPLLKHYIAQRNSIAFSFKNKYGSTEDKKEKLWSGTDGLFAKMRTDLNLKKHFKNSSIKAVLGEVLELKRIGAQYEAKMNLKGVGRKPIIYLASQEAQIISNSLESGLSYSTAWHYVNALK